MFRKHQFILVPTGIGLQKKTYVSNLFSGPLDQQEDEQRCILEVKAKYFTKRTICNCLNNL